MSLFATHGRERSTGSVRATVEVALSVVAGAALTADAGTYRITSYNIDGSGGGASSSSRFRIDGTVNQPSAGAPMVGVKYGVGGGLWTPPEEDSPAPVLSIKPIDPRQISITWSAGAGRQWQLERTAGLGSAVWKAVPGAIKAPVLLPSSDSTAMFRLRQVP